MFGNKVKIIQNKTNGNSRFFVNGIEIDAIQDFSLSGDAGSCGIMELNLTIFVECGNLVIKSELSDG